MSKDVSPLIITSIPEKNKTYADNSELKTNSKIILNCKNYPIGIIEIPKNVTALTIINPPLYKQIAEKQCGASIKINSEVKLDALAIINSSNRRIFRISDGTVLKELLFSNMDFIPADLFGLFIWGPVAKGPEIITFSECLGFDNKFVPNENTKKLIIKGPKIKIPNKMYIPFPIANLNNLYLPRFYSLSLENVTNTDILYIPHTIERLILNGCRFKSIEFNSNSKIKNIVIHLYSDRNIYGFNLDMKTLHNLESLSIITDNKIYDNSDWDPDALSMDYLFKYYTPFKDITRTFTLKNWTKWYPRLVNISVGKEIINYGKFEYASGKTKINIINP